MIRILLVFGLSFFALNLYSQVERENAREFSQMLKDAIGEVDSTKYPVLKLYPTKVGDRSWYDNTRRGIGITGERSPVKKGLFSYDPLDTLGKSFAIKVDADLIAKGLNDAGYNIEGVTKVLSLQYYNAGNGCWVLADTLGVTYTQSNGIGAINVPSGVILFTANIWGQISDLDSDNQYTIQIINNGVSYNTNSMNMRVPDFQIINATSFVAAGPSETMPYIYDEGNAPQRQIISVNGGNLTVRAINLNSFSYWMINLDF